MNDHGRSGEGGGRGGEEKWTHKFGRSDQTPCARPPPAASPAEARGGRSAILLRSQGSSSSSPQQSAAHRRDKRTENRSGDEPPPGWSEQNYPFDTTVFSISEFRFDGSLLSVRRMHLVATNSPVTAPCKANTSHSRLMRRPRHAALLVTLTRRGWCTFV